MIAVGREKKCKCYLYTQSCRLLKAAPVCSRAHWRLSIWWQVKPRLSRSLSLGLSGFFCAIGILMTKLASFLLDPKSHHNHHTTPHHTQQQQQPQPQRNNSNRLMHFQFVLLFECLLIFILKIHCTFYKFEYERNMLLLPQLNNNGSSSSSSCSCCWVQWLSSEALKDLIVPRRPCPLSPLRGIQQRRARGKSKFLLQVQFSGFIVAWHSVSLSLRCMASPSCTHLYLIYIPHWKFFNSSQILFINNSIDVGCVRFVYTK